MIEARLFNAFRAILLLAALLCAAQLAAPLRAQDNNLSASLHAEGPVVAGQELVLAISFTPVSEEWHGYWSNPGDAGLGMELDWQLPDGWQAGEPQYPVPQMLTISGLMNHVYKGTYAVLVPIEVPADYTPFGPVPISVAGQWLACTDEICVPEQGQMNLLLASDPASYTPDPRFAEWRAAIAPPLDSKGTYELTGQSLRVAIPLPAVMELSSPHLFVKNERLVDYAAPQVFRRQGDQLIVEIPRKGKGEAQSVEGILALGGGNGVRIEALPGEVPTGGSLLAGSGTYATPPLWLLLIGALAGGLLLNIMPCVFPILSLKAISLARAGESQAQARSEGLAYTAGVMLACVALGAVMLALRAAGEQVGWAFQLQEPGVVVFLLLLAVAITANLAGLFELPSLSVTRSGEPASAFATGLLAAFVATPCTGPFMAVALGAALLLPPVQALALFAVLGLGLALPFLLIGLIPRLRALLPRPGAWMDKFRKIMAIPMGLTALALAWLTFRLGDVAFGILACVLAIGIVAILAAAGREQRSGQSAQAVIITGLLGLTVAGAVFLPRVYSVPTADASEESILDARRFSEAALAEARASGQPVFVWFTADWCVTCKVNESVAIERETTRAAFEQAGVIAMVGDWTRRDVEISTFLNRQGAAGVPLYLWYAPGASEAEQLPQVLTPDMLIERATRDNSR